MIKKFSVFCIFLFVFSVVFWGLSALVKGSSSGYSSGSGSSYMVSAPSVKFKSWQVGRSDQGTDTGDAEHLSFITSTQTLCHFSASAGYGNITDKQNTSPIDPNSVGWSMQDGMPQT